MLVGIFVRFIFCILQSLAGNKPTNQTTLNHVDLGANYKIEVLNPSWQVLEIKRWPYHCAKVDDTTLWITL